MLLQGCRTCACVVVCQHNIHSNIASLRCMLCCCRAAIEVPVPLEVCWVLWEDRERIPQWMPWIKSVVSQQASSSRLHTHVYACACVTPCYQQHLLQQQQQPGPPPLAVAAAAADGLGIATRFSSPCKRCPDA
jgi:hypothetical protein